MENLPQCLAFCRQLIVTSDYLLFLLEPGVTCLELCLLTLSLAELFVIMWNRERFSVHFRVPTARQFPCQQEWFQHKRRGGYVG